MINGSNIIMHNKQSAVQYTALNSNARSKVSWSSSGSISSSNSVYSILWP